MMRVGQIVLLAKIFYKKYFVKYENKVLTFLQNILCKVDINVHFKEMTKKQKNAHMYLNSMFLFAHFESCLRYS